MTLLEDETRPFTQPAVRNELLKLSHEGDTKTTWDPANEDEVAAAQAMWDALKKKGFAGYSVKPDGTPDSILHEFDATQGRIIMKPALAGG